MLASVPGLPLTLRARFNCAGVGKSKPTPAQLKRARKGKAWNRGYKYVSCINCFESSDHNGLTAALECWQEDNVR